ncbi:MAG: hypothetical protein HYZ17_04245 [Betaproteobacteria bacterium]|nr:hypothetical protein [Betaproteobacteria bacterium]
MEALRRGLVLALLAVAAACAWLKPLDEMAGAQAQAGFKRAVASFATARALNALISVVQGTELSVQPLGVGVTLTPGQMLDPLNDLVERFADLMLLASVAFGVQLLLLELGMHWGMSLALTLVTLAWAWQYWYGKGDPSPARGSAAETYEGSGATPPPGSWLRSLGSPRRASPPALLTRVLVALLLLRFIVPLAGMASEVVYRGFMQQQYTAGQRGIEQASQALGALSSAEGAADKKWWQLDRHIKALGDTIDQAVEHAIRLIVVFLLQTLILPLVVFWILLRSGRMLTGVGAGSHGSA